MDTDSKVANTLSQKATCVALFATILGIQVMLLLLTPVTLAVLKAMYNRKPLRHNLRVVRVQLLIMNKACWAMLITFTSFLCIVVWFLIFTLIYLIFVVVATLASIKDEKTAVYAVNRVLSALTTFGNAAYNNTAT